MVGREERDPTHCEVKVTGRFYNDENRRTYRNIEIYQPIVGIFTISDDVRLVGDMMMSV